MAYNPPWYPDLLASAGFEGAQDLVALWVETPQTPDARLARITKRALKRGGFTIRQIRLDRRGFAEDIDHVLRIYNVAWEKNWGFVPMTEAEFREEGDQVVAFSLTVPDANRALAKIRGRLWPWSALTLWSALKRVDTGRTITLGVLPEFRRSGLDAALIHESAVYAQQIGLRGSECSWVLADNTAMLGAIEQTGGVAYRWYRIYERPL
jgi:ribosomal protein S18 acetylase RimI-like enzyme